MLLSRDGTVPCVKNYWIIGLFSASGICVVFSKEYVKYFNQNRARQSLGQDSPCKKHGKIDFDRSKIRRVRLVGGLIVDHSIAV
jgi:hypothetical protein